MCERVGDEYGSRREAKRMAVLKSLGLVKKGRLKEVNSIAFTDQSGSVTEIPVRTRHLKEGAGTADERDVTAFIPPRKVLRELTGMRVSK